MPGYVIQVGFHSPEPVIIGFPDRQTGNPVGDTWETKKQVGAYNIINRCRVWARRVKSDGTLPKEGTGTDEKPLEVTDPLYRGRLEFLPWGDNKVGAQAMEIRYLVTSSSLDYEYQRTVQKIETRVEDGTMHLTLQPGQNKFDTTKDALLVQMYRVHSQNRDSVSKNPDPEIKGYTYYEVKDENADTTSIKKKEASLDAGILVRTLSSKPQQLRNLIEIFSGYGVEAVKEVNNLSVDTDIYRALLVFSEKNPEELTKQIARYKEEVSGLFEKAKSYEVLDLTKDGFIGFIKNGKPMIVWEGVEGKGGRMLTWVLDNFVEPTVYDQTKQFRSLLDSVSKK